MELKFNFTFLVNNNKNHFNNIITLKDNKKIGNIQYQGCKRKISYQLLEQMYKYKPQAKLFIDCFGGMGASSFRALNCGYKVIYNEFDNNVYRWFKFVINQCKNKKLQSKYGLLPEEYYYFVNKEEFEKSKNKQFKTEKDIFNLLYYSFASGLKVYAFTKRVEYKEQGHNLVLFNKEAPIYREKYKFLEKHIESLERLKMPWRQKRLYFVNIILKLEAIRVSLLYGDATLNEFKDLSFNDFHKLRNVDIVNSINNNFFYKGILIPIKDYKKKVFFDLKQLEQLEQLERLERLERLQQLERLEQLEQDNIILYNNSYEELEDIIKQYDNEYIIIYCDPPYRNTIKYNIDFDYEKFDNWLFYMRKLGYDVFVSEYTQPKNCCEIFNIKVKNNSNATTRARDTNMERLFINKLDF